MAEQKGPPFNGNEGKFVNLKVAANCTKKYRSSAACKELKDKKGAFLGARKILRLLSQEDAVGIRTYFGFEDNGEPQLFLVGVDSKGNDILAADNGVENGESGLVLDNSVWCPIFCGDGNELNQG